MAQERSHENTDKASLALTRFTNTRTGTGDARHSTKRDRHTRITHQSVSSVELTHGIDLTLTNACCTNLRRRRPEQHKEQSQRRTTVHQHTVAHNDKDLCTRIGELPTEVKDGPDLSHNGYGGGGGGRKRGEEGGEESVCVGVEEEGGRTGEEWEVGEREEGREGRWWWCEQMT